MKRHPDYIWSDPTYADQPLDELKTLYLKHLAGRAKKISKETITKYDRSLTSFFRSLDANDDPLVLASVTPFAVERWVGEQRAAGLVEDTIASRLTAVKVFTHKYVFRHLEATTSDLLAKVARIVPDEREIPMLTDEEQEQILGSYNTDSYEDVRNKALAATYMATGVRFRAVLQAQITKLNKLTGELTVIDKGRKEHTVCLSEKALKFVRQYLKVRPANSPSTQIWLTEDGRPLSYWGGQSVFRRLKKRSGVERLHVHLFRHNFAQRALENGADRAEVQDMLNHSDPRMTQHYQGQVRKRQAAQRMREVAPI